MALRVKRDDGVPGDWTSINVSEGGMFLAGPPTLPSESEVRLALAMPGREDVITTGARVVWTNEPGMDDDLPVGMGIEFCGLDDDSRRILRTELYGADYSEPTESLPYDVDLMPGSAIGPYRIECKLGAGGMSCVYRAEHTGLGRKVAIKRLHPHWADDRDAVRRFFDEGRIANRVRDDHIVEITDFFSDGDDKFYVMELLDGLPLDEVLAHESPLPLWRALDIAAQVCDALAIIHDAGIVHRDLKPANIFLVQRGERRDFVKLLDFGIAKLRAPTASLAETTPGMVVGTPTFIAPETTFGAEPDPTADLYALGVVLYQLVTGRPVFVAENWAKMMVAHLNGEPKPASQVRPGGIPKVLDLLILELLAKKPEERPQTARDVAKRLRQILFEIDEDGLPWIEAEPLPPRGRRRKHRWRTVILVACLVALLASGLTLLFGRSGVEPPLTPTPSEPQAAEAHTVQPAAEPPAPAPEPEPAVAPQPAPTPPRRAKKGRPRVHKRGTLDPFAE